MAFVRKRKSGNQLIESYREGGKPKQRIIANLGRYESPEDALEAWREELEEITSTARHAEKVVALHEELIKEDWGEGLERWYDGEVPSLDTVIEDARGELGHASDDEGNWYFDSEYGESFVLITEEKTLGLADFIWDLRELEGKRVRAQEEWTTVEAETHQLEEKIAALEGVVSK